MNWLKRLFASPRQSKVDIPKDMVLVRGGTFEMGDEMKYKVLNNERPAHSVTLSDFLIGKYTVTFEEFDAFCSAIGRAKPNDQGWGRGRIPVINISWEDAVAYCNWRSQKEGLTEVYTISDRDVIANWNAKGYRLPTEGEWEYAAREGGRKVRFGNGKFEADPKEINYFARLGPRLKSVPIGSLNCPNALGLHEMSGNVGEWCWDWYGDYPTAPQTNPKGPSTGSFRVVRGGSWLHNLASVEVYGRDNGSPSERNITTGFRLARNL